jgi:hypothetical protein
VAHFFILGIEERSLVSTEQKRGEGVMDETAGVLLKARERWGEDAVIHRRVGTGVCYVGFFDTDGVNWKGTGATWDEAFLDADLKHSNVA